MPKIKLPAGSGDWTKLQSSCGVELWQRDMTDPGGQAVRFFVVGAEHTPERWDELELDRAKELFDREVEVARSGG